MNPQRVLITGATGFVGCRLAEVLVGKGIDVTGMVRSWHKAARLARLPIRMVQGDLLNPGSVREAMRNCDTVFHCALDSSSDGAAHRQAMVEGTTNVMAAALAENVKKIVYLSSTAVYGFWPTATHVTEETPIPYTGSAYCDGKIDCENVALKYHREHGLPVTILRPTMVYGPFETFWAAHLVRCLGRNWMTLVNGGAGICNSLYIDNLISAMIRAAEQESAVGQVFIISDAQTVTWKQMVERHAEVVKGCRLPLPDATAEEIAAARADVERGNNPSSLRAAFRLLRKPETRSALRTVPMLATAEKVARSVVDRMPDDVLQLVKRAAKSANGNKPSVENGVTAPAKAPVIPLSDHDVRLFTCNVTFSIEKARKLLGYEPRIDFAEGIRRTAEWIRWMRL
ncbi:MAG TPA: NAD(P)-dependent oxidoreductase [Chthoniobacterales bacterium]|nr:NAD(P)-dependent oxidoreductase [Chthoniobacterales bacterium]